MAPLALALVAASMCTAAISSLEGSAVIADYVFRFRSISGGYASLQRSAPIDCSWQPLFGRARAWTCLGQAVALALALAGIPRRAGAPGYQAHPQRRARS